MPTTLFHRTAHVVEILAGGFTDSPNGVPLTAAPTEGDGGQTLLADTILDSLPLDSYSTDGGCWLIPAALLNATPPSDSPATRTIQPREPRKAWLKSQSLRGRV